MKLIWLTLLLLVQLGCSPASKSTSQPAQPNIPQINSATLDPALAKTISTASETVRAAPASAEAWGKLGEAFHAAEFFDEAQSCYLQATRLNPSSGQWLYLLSLLQMQNEPEIALSNMTRSLDFIPTTNDAPRLKLAKALVERGQFDQALPHLTHLLQKNPDHPAARLELARIKFASNDSAAASELLQPSLTNAYTARPALLLLSQIKQRAGDSAAAAQFSSRAASMPRPFDWPDIYLREVQSLLSNQQNVLDRANALIMQQRLEQAEALLNQLLSRDPQDADSLLLLGRLRIQQRRCEEAEQILQRHLAARTNSLQGFVQLGLALFCESKWNDAANAFESAVKLKPDFAQAHYNLGLALSRAGESQKAIESFHNALRSQPGDAATHAALAEELLKLRRPTEALAEAEEALRLDPKQSKALRVKSALETEK
jgi:tetratricopeptide (TPR) repeat protein